MSGLSSISLPAPLVYGNVKGGGYGRLGSSKGGIKSGESEGTSSSSSFLDSVLTSTTPFSTTSDSEELSPISNPISHFHFDFTTALITLTLTAIVLFTVIANFFVVYAFLKRSRGLRAPTHYFIANLALSDGLVGVLALPFLAVWNITDQWYFGPEYCYAWVILHFWLCSCSILNTLGVCVERFVGVKYPIQHAQILSPEKLLLSLASIWITSLSLAIASVIIFPQASPDPYPPLSCVINLRLGHIIFTTVAILYIPAILMIILYSQIFLIARKRLRRLHRSRNAPSLWRRLLEALTCRTNKKGPTILHHADPSTAETSFTTTTNSVPSREGESTYYSSSKESGSSGASQRRQVNIALRLSLLVGLLLATYLPFFTAWLLLGLGLPVNPTAFKILGWTRYFNSCVNPVIYATAVPGYRAAFTSILKA